MAPIQLDQFLKFQGVVESGGQAKLLIRDGQVRVNGQVENRRGRKLHPGDKVEIAGQVFLVPGPPPAPEQNAAP